jgi:uncharacterized membrane protein YkvA (DUF1232 family)
MFKRLAAVWMVVRGDARVLWRALRHPQSPRWLRPAVAGLVLYLVWPADLVPDLVPFFGVLDDVVLIPLAVRWMISRLPAPLRAEIGAL